MKIKRLRRQAHRKYIKLRRTIKRRVKAFPFRRAAGDVLLLLVALQLGVLGANWLNSNNPILGLRLEGQIVGQLFNHDFRKQTNAIIHSYENRELSVKVVDETSTITLRQLGVDIDEKQIYDKLLAKGRTGSIVTRLGDQNIAPLSGRNEHLGHSNFNIELAQKYIGTLDKKIHTSPENAYFTFETQAVIHPDKPGRAIDMEAALAALGNANPKTGKQVTLPTKQLPAEVTQSLLDPLLPEVQAIAQKPLTIAAGESHDTLSPEQLVALVVPKIAADPDDPKKSTAQITFDEAKLNAIIDEVVKKVVVAPKPTIMSGGQVIQQGKSGVSTADQKSLAQVLKVLIQRQTGAAAPDEAQIPLVTVDPPVVQQVANNPLTRTGSGRIRLTFDDGPGGYTDQILNILGRYNVNATFYVIGRNVQSYPGQMQRTKNEGHTICNHTFNHPNLTHLSRAGIQQELSSTQSAISAVTGITPTCFRPPYGAYNQTVRVVAATMGMSLDMWSIDTRDWASPGSSVITSRVLNNTHTGAIVLLHVLNQQTVNALPSIIEGIRAQGYTLE